MLVNRQIPALYNGVSQQPATTRLPSQCEEQVNFYSTVVDGLRRRAPTEHVALITAEDISGALIHTINRDVIERYKVVLTDGDLRVFDLDGNEKTVAFPEGKAYLDVGSPKSDFACVSVADYTFIVNKTVVVSLAALGADVTAQPDSYYWLNRDKVGDDLYGAAVQRQYAPNVAGGTYKGVVQAFAELPETPSNGDIYQIQGTAESAFTTYYVRRNGGVWDETVKPALKNAIDATTLPHALVRKGDGTFEFSPFSFAPRRVGDEATNRNPTFVGRSIRDIFFYKNRLGLCVDENAVLSRAGDFGNFYRLTVIDLLQDETIDVAASETQVTKLNHAVPFNEGMMVFADQVQFRLKHGDVLTPTSCSLDPVTAYKMVPGVKPLRNGADVYFAVEDGDWARIYEYYVRDQSSAADAGDVTGHVPRYIPSGVTQLGGSSEHDVVMVLTNGAPNRVYVYKFYWANETDKPQSAWSYWQFAPADVILSLDVLENYVYLVVKRADGAHLERLALNSGARAPDLTFQLFLDRRAQVTGAWLVIEGKTEFTLPYQVAVEDRARFRIVRGAAFTSAKGAVLSMSADGYEWIDGNTVRVLNDFSAGPCFAGLAYESRYTFSAQFMKNAEGVPIMGGTLVLNSYIVAYTSTAYFRTEIAPYGVAPDFETIIPSRLAEFDGKTLGDAQLVLGEPVLSIGSFRMDVFGESDVATVTLVNDSPYASTFTQAEWEGNWNNRSRTI